MKYTCKLCSFESRVDVEAPQTVEAKLSICGVCLDDIHNALKNGHLFSQVELHLKVQLRRLRHNLQRVTNIDGVVESVLNTVESEISAIEDELGEFISDYPSIAETLSEYRSLLHVYK